jgi:hypothetical protein
MQGDRNRVVNRIVRLLESANFKLGSVATNIVGKSGWLILNAIARGETDPGKLAERAQGSLQLKKAELAEALRGYSSDHFRWLLRQLIDDVSRLDTKLNELDSRIRERMKPHEDLIRRLRTIPGVKEITAWTLIAELGTDMAQFPSAAHAASWAGLCPGNCESAGKRQTGRTRKGDRYLRRMLIQNAWAAARKKDCFLTALFSRIAMRRGPKRAAMAVAHRVLVIAYYIIRDGTIYHEIGGDHYDRLNPERTVRRLTKRLERIGFQVTLTKNAEPVQQPPSKPVRNGTTKWTDAPPHGRRSQLRIPGPIATRDVCSKCAYWKIPCIHGRTAEAPEQRATTPQRPKPADTGEQSLARKPRRGRPCKCAERGLICNHHKTSVLEYPLSLSPEASMT